MIIVDYPTLVSNAFIELNKIKPVKKIKLKEVELLNFVLKQLALENNIKYIDNVTSTTYYELKFNYNVFFNVYEDVDDCTITLNNMLESINLENYFRKSPNIHLLKLLEMVDFEDIFCIDKVLN